MKKLSDKDYILASSGNGFLVTSKNDFNKYLIPVVASVIGLVIIYVRYRYLNIPFERDEGEYAYGAQVLLNGQPLYKNLYSLKWPGIFLSYALIIAVFGASIWGVHFGLLIVHLLTTFIVFRIARNFFSTQASLLGAVGFMVFMVQKELQGIMANSEHFVVLFLAASLLLFVRFRATGKYVFLVWSGIFSGIALITKQHAIGYLSAFFLVIVLINCNQQRYRPLLKQIFSYGLGVLAPGALVFILILLFDDISRFWFQTVTYAGEYVNLTSWEEGWFELKKRLVENFSTNPVMWVFATSGVIGVYFSGLSKSVKVTFYCLLIGALISISLGLYFRPHYVLFLPIILSLFLAYFYQEIMARTSASIAAILFFIAGLTYFLIDSGYLFRWDANLASQRLYYGHPFREAILAGEFVKENSQDTDRVLVVGAEPQINFYSGRQSVTGYVYTYPFFENHPYRQVMSDEWIDEINSDHPEFIVLMGHWITYIDKENEMFRKIWGFANNFIENNDYRKVGIVDIPVDKGKVIFGSEAEMMQSQSENWIYIYQKPVK